MKRRRRVGVKAKARRAAGGQRALGRASAPSAEYRAAVTHVWERACGQCEVTTLVIADGRLFGRCDNQANDVHHVIKRSRGGDDATTNLVALCRAHHDQTDAPYRDGRLVIRSLGNERFEFTIVTKEDKWCES